MISELIQYQGNADLFKLNFQMVFLKILASANKAGCCSDSHIFALLVSLLLWLPYSHTVCCSS